MSKAALMMAAIAMASGHNDPFEARYRNIGHVPETRDTNKYNLSEEEIELISEMTPKEKKLFFKNRKARK